MAKRARRRGIATDPAPEPAAAAADPVAAAATEAPAASGRRRLLLRLWSLLGIAATAELAWIVTAFLRPRRRSVAASAGVVVAGPLERFEPGSVTAFPAGRFYLVRLPQGGFLALYRECTHLGCTVPWVASTRRFQCPCHASAFDITGAVLGPPAPRPLDLYPVRIENGIVKVDTGERQRRQAFEPSQVVTS
jgi:cytochrome b6-f complex iron-sulfur subunit